MFTKADLDDDGFVTSEDFYNILTHQVYWQQWNPWSLNLFTKFILINKDILKFIYNLLNININWLNLWSR